MYVDTQERKQGEQQVGALKLSEAIRRGAKLRPQCSFVPFDADGNSCAIGAAYEAVYGYPGVRLSFGSIRAYASLSHLRGFGENFEEIYQRNDAGESREQIADWLESQGC